MSTFIELVQQLHIESGASGSTPPGSVVGQTGEIERLVNWVRQADLYVQSSWHNWNFLYKRYQQSTTTDVDTLQPPSDLNIWDHMTFTVDGDPIEAKEYISVKRFSFDTNTNTPSLVIIMPDSSLKFQPIPDAAYQIEADYFIRPIPLQNNNDISKIPAQYQQIIIGRALILYGNYEAAPEIVEQGEQIYQEVIGQLESSQLPNIFHSRYNSSGNFLQVVAE